VLHRCVIASSSRCHVARQGADERSLLFQLIPEKFVLGGEVDVPEPEQVDLTAKLVDSSTKAGQLGGIFVGVQKPLVAIGHDHTAGL
jgi:hypothetical protein